MNVLISLFTILLIVGFLGALFSLVGEGWLAIKHMRKAWRWRAMENNWKQWGGL